MPSDISMTKNLTGLWALQLTTQGVEVDWPRTLRRVRQRVSSVQPNQPTSHHSRKVGLLATDKFKSLRHH